MKVHINVILSSCLLFVAACSTKETKEEVYPVYKVSIEPETVSLFEGESFQLSAIVLPSKTTGYTVDWSSDNPNIVTIDANGKIDAKIAGNATIIARVNPFEARCKVSVRKIIPKGAVDLGLSVYWAECNVGATKPEEYGEYYAWGEVATKDVYSNATYKWFQDGLENRILKYCSSDNKNYWAGPGEPDGLLVLEASDDVASVMLGEAWRTPTNADFIELLETKNNENYEWKWDIQKDHDGWSIKYLMNGNSIFFPAAGLRDNETIRWEHSHGFYMGSSLYGELSYGSGHLQIHKDFTNLNEGGFRWYGFSVRAVSDTQ